MDNSTSLAVAKATVNHGKNDREGITCPCCGQLCKVYRRRLNSAMARFLIWLARYSMDQGYDPNVGGPWVRMDRFPIIQRRPGGGDFAKLRYWGMIEEMDNSDTSKRSSGVWRITPNGMSFARGNMPAPEAVLVYNNECEGLTGAFISIRIALGTKFNYDSLWSQAAV